MREESCGRVLDERGPPNLLIHYRSIPIQSAAREKEGKDCMHMKEPCHGLGAQKRDRVAAGENPAGIHYPFFLM